MSEHYGALHAKLCSLGQILAGYSESDFARAAAGSGGEDLLNLVTGLCFNAADEIERLQDAVRLLTPPCGMGITIGSCSYPGEAPSVRDMPCCVARRAIQNLNTRAETPQSIPSEREEIVKWLRATDDLHPDHRERRFVADEIARGDHLTRQAMEQGSAE